ncbi:hypothetical protein AWZ03_015377, partial [Drosophila navojoa]
QPPVQLHPAMSHGPRPQYVPRSGFPSPHILMTQLPSSDLRPLTTPQGPFRTLYFTTIASAQQHQ